MSLSTDEGTARWMSPEIIDPQRFGIKKNRHTKSSDCYALGMVIYETVSGRVPFHQVLRHGIGVRILNGERPLREAGFTDSLWKMVELCWKPQPGDRPSVEDVLQCLEIEQPYFGLDAEVEEGGKDGDDLHSWDVISCKFSSFIPTAESHIESHMKSRSRKGQMLETEVFGLALVSLPTLSSIYTVNWLLWDLEAGLRV